MKSNDFQFTRYQKNYNYKKFLWEFLLRSEVIGFGVLTPIYAIIVYFSLDFQIIHFSFLISAIIAVLILLIYVFISTFVFLKPIKRLIKFIFENEGSLKEEELRKYLNLLFRLPLRRSIDVLIRIILGSIVFSVILSLFVELNLFQFVVITSILFMFSSSGALIYYFLLEYMVIKLVNSEVFRSKVQIANLENIRFVKLKYVVSYLLFLVFFFFASSAGFVSSQFGEYWSKQIQRESSLLTLISIKDELNSFFINLKNEMQKNELNSKEKISHSHFLSTHPIVLDYGIFDLKENEFIYLQSHYLLNEIEEIKKWIKSNQKESFFPYTLTKGEPIRVLAWIRPFQDEYFHVLFLKANDLERKIFRKSEKDNMFFLTDEKGNILTSSSLEFLNQNVINLSPLISLEKESSFFEDISYNRKSHELQYVSSKVFPFKIANLFDVSLYQERISFAVFLIVSLFLSGGLILIGIIFYVLNTKLKHLENINEVINFLSQGRFHREVLLITNDEFGDLAISISNLKENLYEIITQTKKVVNLVKDSAQSFIVLVNQLVQDSENEAATTEEISATIEEISASMDRISEYASEQNHLIENLSKTVNDLTIIIKQAQENLKEIKEIIAEADTLKSESEKEMNTITKAMGEIQETSSKITSITGIVKDIAEQINLLSLNASIEAARAGEYGKGFAVVADEVSKLAEKTRSSIKDINTLIKNSSNQIQQGIQITNNFKELLGRLLKEFQKIHQLSSKISEVITKQEFVNVGVLSQTDQVKKKSQEVQRSTDEQKLAVREITSSISTINRAILSSTENVRKIHSIAKELESKIQEVEQVLQYFHIQGN
ncbi:MAG: methyl-accepting chemotaxis protein [Leptospiraceae bacterium]|nr:methyl-accepting chemotaxis protein [Leptospiraceae bacterium]MDW7975139.1 methyl-accepting chemotaxis protein [Leptospiraceae bacterium]